MPPATAIPWTPLTPPLTTAASRDAFAAYAKELVRLAKVGDRAAAVHVARGVFTDSVNACRRGDRQALLSAGLVLSDLVAQGWGLRVHSGEIAVQPPAVNDDHASEKERVRRQELIKRDAQLDTESVRKFIQSMERPRPYRSALVSIFNLMRDGRTLTDQLRDARRHLSNGWAEELAGIVDPYLDFVSSEHATCALTGLRLMDVWRYFRHTWTNQYTSVPGRSMLFLVRDRAAPFHPIVGIGALNSPIMQLRERDTWIGWHPNAFLERVRTKPTLTVARWLVSVVDDAIAELYVDDFLEDGILSMREILAPSEATLSRLRKEGASQRALHHRFVHAAEHKRTPANADATRWIRRARSHLFRSKRALALATYFKARQVLHEWFGETPTAQALGAMVATAEGADTIRKILRKAKGDRVGIAVADISVCGAVQPYNAILGGKLVAALATSPEVVNEYRRRYRRAESEIASAMAGRPIVREPTLVMLGTTSLYGVGSSQYNRIKIPCEACGGAKGEIIRFAELGRSEAFGTSQYSEETVHALTTLVQQSAGGQRVNSIFGEGVSPKLRKVRQGLDLLRFPSDLFLRHHRQRVIYGVSLVRNLADALLGLSKKPQYYLPLKDGAQSTRMIAAWWRDRWLRNRIMSDEVLNKVARHTLVRPIRHGARVAVSVGDQQVLFAETV